MTLQFVRPTPTGGKIFRHVHKFCKSYDLLNLNKLYVACSGGSDSIALAHLLIKYGKRIVSKENICILHINHHLRENAIKDEKFVESFALNHGVSYIKYDLDLDTNTKNSIENIARMARLNIFYNLNAPVLTAHHKDDLAETILWRFFTGSLDKTPKSAIYPKLQNIYRPLLSVEKSELTEYLKEENQDHINDETNFHGVLLRSNMRINLIPHIKEVFPGWKGSIIK